MRHVSGMGVRFHRNMQLVGFILPNDSSTQTKSITPEWGELEYIYENSNVTTGALFIDQDQYGNLHTFWSYYSLDGPRIYGTFYIKRDNLGNWSDPETLPILDLGDITYETDLRNNFTAIVDNDGTLFTFWTSDRLQINNYTAFSYKPLGGNWSEPELLPFIYRNHKAIIGPDGTLHLFGVYNSGLHFYLPEDGTWVIEDLPTPFYTSDFEIDLNNKIHYISDSFHGSIEYTIYDYINKTWNTTTIHNTSNTFSSPQLSLDSNNNIHTSWWEYSEYECFPVICTKVDLYYRGIRDSVLTDVFKVNADIVGAFEEYQIEPGIDGNVHFLWNYYNPDSGFFVGYRELFSNGNWGGAYIQKGRFAKMRIGYSGDIHILWLGGYLVHMWRLPNSDWSPILKADPDQIQTDVSNGIQIASGKANFSENLHSLYLIFKSRSRFVFNSFSISNVPTPTPTSTSTKTTTPTQTKTPTLSPTPKPPKLNLFLPIIINSP